MTQTARKRTKREQSMFYRRVETKLGIVPCTRIATWSAWSLAASSQFLGIAFKLCLANTPSDSNIVRYSLVLTV
jgi:hypothetical protein